jgi:hypothetical protein
MKNNLEDFNADHCDRLIEEELAGQKLVSLKRTLAAARGRRRKGQLTALAVPFVLLASWAALTWIPTSVSHDSQEVVSIKTNSPQPDLSPVNVKTPAPESSTPIQILSDAEFDEMMKGYPLAIIRINGKTRYIPLDP